MFGLIYGGWVTEYAAVLWDLDGTIVDTEPLWMAAEHALAAEHGKIWTEEDGLALVGNSLIASGHYIREKLEIEMSAEDVVDYLVRQLASSLSEHIDWRPGARDLIEALAAEGVPQALVTMSYTPIAEPVVASLPFKAVVTGDIVSRPKPHPDPYLLAAELLGVDAGGLPRDRGLRHGRRLGQRCRLRRPRGAALRQRAGSREPRPDPDAGGHQARSPGRLLRVGVSG